MSAGGLERGSFHSPIVDGRLIRDMSTRELVERNIWPTKRIATAVKAELYRRLQDKIWEGVYGPTKSDSKV